MTEKIRQFWDKNASRYDDSERKSEAVNKEILAKTIKYLTADDMILDFGCATGNKANELSKKVKFIHGLDISPEMIKLANQKKEAINIPNISFSSGTIFNDDLIPGTFDTIVSYAVIHLLEDKEDVIGRIYNLLRPGGLFIALIPCFKDKKAFSKGLEIKIYLLMKKLGIFPLHLNMFASKDVENLLRGHHFKIIETEKMFDGISASFVIAQK